MHQIGSPTRDQMAKALSNTIRSTAYKPLADPPQNIWPVHLQRPASAAWPYQAADLSTLTASKICECQS